MSLASKENTEVEIVIHSELPQNRKCTDVAFFMGFIICILLAIPFAVVFSMGGDISRFLYGYDRHGNICGIKNTPIYGINCSGQDMTLRPIAMIKYYPINRCFRNSDRKILPDKCVDTCEKPNELIFHRCYPPQRFDLDDASRYFKEMTEILHVLSQSTTTILAMTLTGLALSFAVFYSLRCHHLIVTFWALVIFQMTATAMVAAVFWHKYIISDYEVTLYLLVTLAAIIYFIFVLTYITLLHNSVMVSVRLYEEALDAIFKMPILLLHSVLILLTVIAVSAVLGFVIILACSNGCLQQSEDPFTLEYNTNLAPIIFACFTAFMMLWIFAFFEGWQTFIVSSAVGMYHAARDKNALKQPFKQSYQILTHYHLGTLAYGSFIVSLFSFIRGAVEYTIRKVYVQTALHGHSLPKSSIRVMKLLSSNLVPTIAFTGFNYILTCGLAFLIMSLTVCLGLWLNLDNTSQHYGHVGVLFGAAIACTASMFIYHLLNVATDTVFLRSCEENVLTKSGYYNNSLSVNATVTKVVRRAKAFKQKHFTLY